MVPDTPSTSNGSDTTSRLAAGAVAGAVTYGVGYVLTYLLTSGDVRESGLARITEAVTGDEVVWQIVGWLFYNAHLVPAQVPAPGPQAAVNPNVVTGADGIVVGLLALPPVLLAGAGWMVTRGATDSTQLRFDFGVSGRRYAINGALVTMLGYLPLSILGTLAFGIGGLNSVGPDQYYGLVVAGAIYPLVFGGIGGYLGRPADPTADEPPAEERMY
jgi:hypothetical protein